MYDQIQSKPDLNQIKDMIYGECINFKEFKNNPRLVIQRFLQQDFKSNIVIPYYQNCKNITLQDIVKQIVVNL